VEHYNNVRLNSAIGYITPKHMLAGHQQEIQAARDRKLETKRTAGEPTPLGRVTRITCC
jgi:putative transposase